MSGSQGRQSITNKAHLGADARRQSNPLVQPCDISWKLRNVMVFCNLVPSMAFRTEVLFDLADQVERTAGANDSMLRCHT